MPDPLSWECTGKSHRTSSQAAVARMGRDTGVHLSVLLADLQYVWEHGGRSD